MAIELEDLCTTVQQNLDTLATQNYPAFNRRPVGLLDAVRSDVNRAGFSEKYRVDDGDGKLKQVVIEWAQPVPVSTTVTSEQDVCEAGTEEPRFLDTVELTGYAGTRVMEFSEEALRKYCESPSQVETMRIAQHLSGLFEKIDQILVSKFNAGVGGLLPGATNTLPLLHYDTDGQTTVAKADGEIKLLTQLSDMGVVGSPLVVGSGIIEEYARLKDIACCNEFGQDLSRQTGAFNWYKDREVDRMLAGSNNILAFAPGAVQMATYNKFRGEFRKEVPGLFRHTTIIDPVTGIELDMLWKYDDCNFVWRLHIGLHFDLFMMPLELFKDADEFDGINYAWLYQGTKTGADS